MLLEDAKNIYENANVAIGDDNAMRAHILQCVAALSTVHKASASSRNEINRLVQKCFWDCMLEIIFATTSEAPDRSPAIDMLMNAVSESKEWFPIHGIAACEKSTDTKLQSIGRNFPDHRNKAAGSTKLTPLHIASAKLDPNLKIVNQLINFSIRMCRIKDVNGDLPLHYAARWSNSILLMQELLQAYPDGAMAKNDKGETFLHLLCSNISPEAPAILRMVLAAVPNVAKIQSNDGDLPLHVLIRGNLPDTIRQDMAQQLISVYPEGAAVPNEKGVCPIHNLAYRKDKVDFLPILKKMLDGHPAAARVADADGCLPLHVVEHTDMAKQLVEVYKEALGINVTHGGTPLHQAAGGHNVELFRYIHSCRPESLHETTNNGLRVIHFCSLDSSSLAMLQAVHEFDPSAIYAIDDDGWTPLHVLINKCFRGKGNPSFNNVGKLHFFLQKHPEAASILDNKKQTPYSMCHVNHTHARRLLLRAAPALDPETLHELNYSARRTALFLFFLGVRDDGKRTLFTNLSLSPKGQSLVRKVVEFL